MTYYDLSAKEVASVVQADTRNGLTQAEAQRRLTAFGENKLDEKKKKPLVVRFLEQFKDAMIIILLIAAVISFGVACYQVFGTGESEPLHSPLFTLDEAALLNGFEAFRRLAMFPDWKGDAQ